MLKLGGLLLAVGGIEATKKAGGLPKMQMRSMPKFKPFKSKAVVPKTKTMKKMIKQRKLGLVGDTWDGTNYVAQTCPEESSDSEESTECDAECVCKEWTDWAKENLTGYYTGLESTIRMVKGMGDMGVGLGETKITCDKYNPCENSYMDNWLQMYKDCEGFADAETTFNAQKAKCIGQPGECYDSTKHVQQGYYTTDDCSKGMWETESYLNWHNLEIPQCQQDQNGEIPNTCEDYEKTYLMADQPYSYYSLGCNIVYLAGDINVQHFKAAKVINLESSADGVTSGKYMSIAMYEEYDSSKFMTAEKLEEACEKVLAAMPDDFTFTGDYPADAKSHEEAVVAAQSGTNWSIDGSELDVCQASPYTLYNTYEYALTDVDSDNQCVKSGATKSSSSMAIGGMCLNLPKAAPAPAAKASSNTNHIASVSIFVLGLSLFVGIM